MIVANRYGAELDDVREKVYTGIYLEETDKIREFYHENRDEQQADSF